MLGSAKWMFKQYTALARLGIYRNTQKDDNIMDIHISSPTMEFIGWEVRLLTQIVERKEQNRKGLCGRRLFHPFLRDRKGEFQPPQNHKIAI